MSQPPPRPSTDLVARKMRPPEVGHGRGIATRTQETQITLKPWFQKKRFPGFGRVAGVGWWAGGLGREGGREAPDTVFFQVT